MYFCVGGPPEVVDGAVWAGGPFANMETPDAVVERRLLRAVAACGTVITMGTRAAAFFREKGVQTDFRVVSGGIDSKAFLPATTRPSIDLIFTGRLVDIKRIDVFLEAVKHVARQLPDVRAVVVGDGQMRHALTQLAGDLGISHCVSFVGHQRDVGDWLRKSKLFVLTSDSEGLSLAMMEAMTCGLPAVVSNVGDLADMVEDGVNGYLVPRRSPETFAERIVELLRDEQKLAGLSRAARRTAFQHETASVMRQWDEILARERCT